MVNINPQGFDAVTGQKKILGLGDAIVDTYNNVIGTTGYHGIFGTEGITGTQTAQGVTGFASQGVTGLSGFTGLQNLSGITGSQGVTGLQGQTGISTKGVTGLQGLTGTRGQTGLQGLQGRTGLQGITGSSSGATGIQGSIGFSGATGIRIQGVTGLQGATGLIGATGIAGATGSTVQGLTGLAQGTGIQGTTGIYEFTTLDVQRQTSGVTLSYIIPGNTFTTNSQHLEFIGSGLTATDGSTTTINIVIGTYPVFSGSASFAGGAAFIVKGFLILDSAFLQETSITLITQNNISEIQWNSVTVDLSLSQTLYLSLGSAGAGHFLSALILGKLENP